jgi:hypothetical protein
MYLIDTSEVGKGKAVGQHQPPGINLIAFR